MAVREGGGVTYTPNLVPQTQIGDEPVSRIIDIERFLEEELTRIALAMVVSVVQAAYGALTVDPGPAPDQPLVDGVPAAVEGFNNFTPQVPNRITAQQAPDSLIPEEGGIYQILANMTVAISSGTEYTLTAAVNGTLTGIFATVDSSNQTNVIQLVLYGMIALNPGDVVTLIVIANGPGGPHIFIMESAIYGMTRISERNDEPGVF